MADIFVGNVAVGVVPDARGWNNKLRAELVPSADQVGKEYGQHLSSGVVKEMGSTRARTEYAKAGETNAGAFGTSFRKRLEAAMKNLPDIELKGDSSDTDRKLAEIRKKIDELSHKKIGVDLDATQALEMLTVLEAEMSALQKQASNIDVKFNLNAARAQMALFRAEVGRDININVDTSRGIVGRIGGGISRGIAGAVGAGEAGIRGVGAVSAGLPIIGNAIGVLPPQAQAAITGTLVAAVAAAAPLIAAGLGGAIVAGFGIATGAIAAIGAAQDPLVGQTFETLKERALEDFQIIGMSWVTVLESILNTAKQVLDSLTPVFKAAADTIAGPMRTFADTVLRAFTQPAVKASIQNVADAFAAILTALTPEIPGIMTTLANSISAIATVIQQHPHAFTVVIDFFVAIVNFGLRALVVLIKFGIWLHTEWQKAIKRFKENIAGIEHFWDKVRETWFNVWHGIVGQWHLFLSDMKRIWHDISTAVMTAWNWLWDHTVGTVVRAHQAIQRWLDKLFHNIAHIFDVIRHTIASVWDTVWNNTIGRLIRGVGDVMRWFGNLKTRAINFFSGAITWLVNAGRNILSGLWNGIKAVWSTVSTWFSQMGTRIKNWFTGAANWLLSAGGNVISGLLTGIKNGLTNIGTWVKTNIVDPVVNWVKRHFGISSPSTIMSGIGKNLIAGLLHGIFTSAKGIGGFITKVFGGWPEALGKLLEKGLINVARLPAKALNALMGVGGKIAGVFGKIFGGGTGGGVNRWTGIVGQAMGMLGIPMAYLGSILYQMQTESGGNPTIVNTWDINWQQGHPSVGLMQVIAGTFARWAGPFRNVGPFSYGVSVNPLANVYAALNYALHGRGFGRGPGQIGSGHGYAEGGPIFEPVVGVGLGSGSMYSFGERGREWVVPESRMRRASGTEYHAHFDGLTRDAIESHVMTAFSAMSLTQGALSRNGRRS